MNKSSLVVVQFVSRNDSLSFAGQTSLFFHGYNKGDESSTSIKKSGRKI